MKISRVTIQNFRRLQDVEFTLEPDSTLFVGPNNSGKTSATAAFRLFFKGANFSVSDFNVACIRAIDELGNDPSADVPRIAMDLWLTIDPKQIEFGRAFSLLPDVALEHDKVGMRLSFEARDVETMCTEFRKAFPKETGKTLSEYLGFGKNLGRYFSINYYALEESADGVVASAIEADEGRRVLGGLVRIDFIDAQRNMHDDDTARHNRLSSAFAAYYKHNLEKPAENAAATKIIDENNSSLTNHYEKHFEKLLKNVATLGVPSAHDRKLRLVSSLTPQEALQGNTVLYYEDSENHRLPEAYNGLGFKNLVYMAIQVSHYHAQWMAIEVNRPLCQLIFIEEPEVHLHAQVQQVFIKNIHDIMRETANDAGEQFLPPQLVISTHSSHVVETVQFEKVRYFRRCPLKLDGGKVDAPLVASNILNLQNFTAASGPDVALTEEEAAGLSEAEKAAKLAEKNESSRLANLQFLKKYVKLTHCDLFFADAAILVEGTVEKLLMGQMIAQTTAGLDSRYITVLEVGGAYAHIFASLMSFLGIPYVVITDIDTVDPADARKACPAVSGTNTSNPTLKHFFKVKERDALIAVDATAQVLEEGRCYVSFQRPLEVTVSGRKLTLHGRTLEEQFVYENLTGFREGKFLTGYDFAQGDPLTIADDTYDQIRMKNFKKTEFALGIAASDGWSTPSYITDALKWLDSKLAPMVIVAKVVEQMPEAAE
jgi:predicted ATP-dependent endonuclease of OLD family